MSVARKGVLRPLGMKPEEGPGGCRAHEALIPREADEKVGES